MVLNAAGLDRWLAGGPFADPREIDRDVEVYLDGLRALIGRWAGIDLRSLADREPLRRPTVRASLDEALSRASRGAPRAEVRSALAAVLASVSCAPRVASNRCAAAGPLAVHVIATSDDDPGLLEIRRRIETDLAGADEGPGILVDGDVAIVERALERLRDILPAVADATLAGTALVAIVDARINGKFITAAPHTVIVNEAVAARVATCADALLHESLHQKIMDLTVTRGLFRPGYDDESSALAEIPWSPLGGRRRVMPTSRLLATFHVYVHTALLWSQLDEPDAAERFTRDVGRARFMAAALTRPEHAGALAADGTDMVDWLEAALTELAAAAASPNFDLEVARAAR